MGQILIVDPLLALQFLVLSMKSTKDFGCSQLMVSHLEMEAHIWRRARDHVLG